MTYRYAVTVPANTSVFDGSLTDTLPAGFVLTTPAPTAEFCPSAPTPTMMAAGYASWGAQWPYAAHATTAPAAGRTKHEPHGPGGLTMR